jgi:3-hydroxyisobutyrate dehydrogenase-like beta-hydroxyacid dehydrogenase
VGVIGLGNMGLPLVIRLIDSGYVVRVAARTKGSVARACDRGATDGVGVLEVVRESDVTFICVPRSADVERIIETVLPAVRGKIIIDVSTIDPDVEREQHERVSRAGGQYLEAPISGGPERALQGRLTVMAGGDAATLDDVRPLLMSIASLIVPAGGAGMGQVIKICNNVISAVQMLVTAEAAVLARKAGADLERLREAVSHSTGDCVTIRTRIPFEGVCPDGPPSQGWRPDFSLELMAKDVDLALGLGSRLGAPLLSPAVVRQVLSIAEADGFGNEDFSALGKVIRRLGGV